MQLKLYDNRTKKYILFTSIDLNDFFIYTCGPTVYDDPHIGNFRPIFIANLLRQVIKYCFLSSVHSLQSITDIDDKIIIKAKEKNISPIKIASKYDARYISLSNKLRVNNFKYLRVIENIDSILDYILMLDLNSFTKTTESEISFNTSKIGSKYWQFIPKTISNKNLNFALWKINENEFGFKSIFGKGRPGWHTECASFIYFYGKNHSVHVHIGGQDLKFPHHQNEIAQHIALTNNDSLAKVWVHVGNLRFKKHKMSKSLGNLILMKNLLKQYQPEIIKLWMLSVNYKNEIVFSYQSLNIFKEKFLNWTIFINQIYVFFKMINYNKEWLDILNNTSVDNSIILFLLDNLKTTKAINHLDILFSKSKKYFLRIEKWDKKWFKKEWIKKNKIFVIDSVFKNKTLKQCALFIKSLSFICNTEIFFDITILSSTIELIKRWLNMLDLQEYEKADNIRKTLSDLLICKI